FINGTSMAAPQVAGTAALILSLGYQPVATLKSMILNGVDQLPSLTNFVATGGRLNVCKAVPGCSSAVTGIPANSALPEITGQTQYGSVLGASTGLWSGLPTSYAYQWDRCNSGGSSCAPIAGATAASYAPLASADVGATLSVAVTASNSISSASAQSSAAVISGVSSPFGITSTINDGAMLSGSVQWQVTPSTSV